MDVETDILALIIYLRLAKCFVEKKNSSPVMGCCTFFYIGLRIAVGDYGYVRNVTVYGRRPKGEIFKKHNFSFSGSSRGKYN